MKKKIYREKVHIKVAFTLVDKFKNKYRFKTA